MSNFRNFTPKRRVITKSVSSHRDYRDDLRLDFKCRCGYCNDIDIWRTQRFEVDHFVPRKHLTTISETDYSNLVYSCRSCNNAKRAKWPTNNDRIHNDNNIGFIDPCDDQYNNQFERLSDGKIKPKTTLGQWMFIEMKLYKIQHEVIWLIEQCDILISEIEEYLNDNENNSELSNRLLKLYQAYRSYTKQLSNYE